MTTDRASDWDREYMRRIGRYKEESARDRLRLHLQASGWERLCVIDRLAADLGVSTAQVPIDEGPVEFYRRARRLGLVHS